MPKYVKRICIIHTSGDGRGRILVHTNQYKGYFTPSEMRLHIRNLMLALKELEELNATAQR